jgi:hypothetical protein
MLPTIPTTTSRPDRLTSILGARLSWHFANGWVFDPAIVGPNIVDYTLKRDHTLDGMPSSTSTANA